MLDEWSPYPKPVSVTISKYSSLSIRLKVTFTNIGQRQENTI